MSRAENEGLEAGRSRRSEILTFLFTIFVLMPGLAIAFVGSYGLIVWTSQMIFGPPGPPAG